MKRKITQFITTIVLIITVFANTAFFTIAAPLPELTKDEIGLNVHWALGGFGADDEFRDRLKESDTLWVREHFYNEVLMGDNQEAWLARYDKIMREYRKQGIRVVGMLAYGPKHGDMQRPHDEQWRSFVELVVKRYGDYVKVWEVWNEPDSPDFLAINNPWYFQPIMEIGYDTIKKHYPEATVLNGGLTGPNPHFAKVMYEEYGDKFDAMTIHIYACERFYEDGDFRSLDYAMDRFKTLIDQYRPNEKVWITEIGCSTASPGIDAARQAYYFERVFPHLFQKGWIKKVFIYTIRNRDINNPYEDEFGLMRIDMAKRLSWEYYEKVPVGPYGQRRRSVAIEQMFSNHLRMKLDKFFKEGFIHISEDQWPRYVNAYLYGRYPLDAIIKAARHHGKTVHPSIPYQIWRETQDYKEFIEKI
jgi:polysaccharide biosynthesis protein PslG